ncbi:acyltransferase family protein [Zavarzinia sp. CC-PAN008]|uniref:acyltransferase family protein n=1 Tax=Zavarzinia sp. CC-PAN008 TaxID=3243332 RepID=UPI003F7495D7
MLRFTSVEGLRAWMAWWVVVSHALQLGGITPQAVQSPWADRILGILTNGRAPVCVFIIVSGFVIAHLLLSKDEGYGTYILRRWLRLFPIFLVCLVAALAVRELYLVAYTGYPWPFSDGTKLERAAAESGAFWEHLALHLSMFHGVPSDDWMPYASSTFLIPAWSLSLEWQFYLVAPFLIPLLSFARWQLGAILVAAILAAFLALDRSGLLWRFPSFLPLAMPYFLIGIGCRMLLQPLARGEALYWGAIVAASVAVLLAADGGKLALVVWLAFVPIILAEGGKLRLRSRLVIGLYDVVARSRAITMLGKWSYSTYLVHIPLFALVVGGYAELNGRALSQETAWALIAACVVAVAPLSWLLYERVERPFIDLGSRIARARTGTAVPGVSR